MSTRGAEPPATRPTSQKDEQDSPDARLAMRLSLIFGLLQLLGKLTAYFMTHSAAILSDAAESVVYVVAVGFPAFSLPLSAKPATPQFLSGYERITFFFAGFEGAMIILAAFAILARTGVYKSCRKTIPRVAGHNLQFEHC